jgi:hypothetical protein
MLVLRHKAAQRTEKRAEVALPVVSQQAPLEERHELGGKPANTPENFAKRRPIKIKQFHSRSRVRHPGDDAVNHAIEGKTLQPNFPRTGDRRQEETLS